MPKNIADTGWHCLEKPDMDNRDSKIDMGHAFAAHFREGDFDTAAIADNPFVFDLLVLSAGAFPIARRAEDLLAEQSAFFRLEGAVVDRLRFFNLPA